VNLQDGRKAGSRTPMETELSNWLHGLEPGGTPVSLRFQTFADLREEAASPRSRFARPIAALSSAASLGTVVAAAGLMLLALVFVAGLGHTTGVAGGAASVPGAGQGSTPSMDGYEGPGMNPLFIVGLPLATLIAAASVLWPSLRRAPARLAFGTSSTTPAAPLPLPRNLRSISRLAWVLGAVAVAFALWFEFENSFNTSPAAYWFSNLIAPIILVPFWMSVALRYPMTDRSARLILASTVMAITVDLLFIAITVVHSDFWYPYGLDLIYVVQAGWVVALAAGVAGRSGGVPRPRLAIAGVAIGAAFVMSATFVFMFGFDWSDPSILSLTISGVAEAWIVKVAWLAMAWVGWDAARRPGAHWGWWLVCAAGALTLLAGVPEYLLRVYSSFATIPIDPAFLDSPGAAPSVDQAQAVSWTLWNAIDTLRLWWGVVLGLLATALLAVALLSGLRPAPDPARTDPPTSPDGDDTAPDGHERQPSIVEIATS
jgi:hypothetical protein